AKKSILGINLKDNEIYPIFSKLVEFWILYGDSNVEIYYLNSSINISLDQFNEDEYLMDQNIERIVIFRSSDDLIKELKQKIRDRNKKRILSSITKIKKLRKTGAKND
ncbi:MAG: hypothetical protein ACFFFH_10225, partial [Candidatus Thorarchaeota archaeon]